MCTSDIILGLIAILFPPVAVWIKSGLCTADSLINILLCMLGYIPGLLHAWYIIAKNPEVDYDSLPQDGGESGRGGNGNVTYYYVGPGDQQQQQQQQGPQQARGERGYGTTGPKMVAPLPSGGQGQGAGAGEGSAAAVGVPPSYEQAVRGDHKVQT